jgi:hypothetical protein
MSDPRARLDELRKRKRLEELRAKAGNQPTRVMDGAGDATTNAGFFGAIPVVGAPLQNMMQGASSERRGQVLSGMVGAANAASLGTVDDIAGAISPEAGQGADLMKQYAREENPKSTFAGEVTGGLMTGGAGLQKVAGSKALGAAATGAAYGAAYGAGEAEGGLKERATGAAYGGAFGAAGGFLIQKAGQGLKQLITQRNFRVNGELTDEARQLIQQYGIDPNDIPPNELDQMEAYFRQGNDAQQAAFLNDVSQLPQEIPLTRANITRDVDDALLESRAAKGNFGGDAQVAMQGFRGVQDDALKANAETLQGGAVSAYGEGAEGVIRRVQGESEALKGQAKSLRAKAKNGNAFVSPESAKALKGTFENILEDEGYIRGSTSLPKVSGVLDDLNLLAEKFPEGVPVNALAQWRRKVSNLSKGVPDGEKNMLGKLSRSFNEEMVKAIDNSMVQGDEEAIKQWRKSTELFAEWFRTYQGKRGAKKIVAEMVNDDLTAEAASNKIIGTGKQNAGKIVAEMKEFLGADSPEFQDLRKEAAFRLMGQRPGERFSGQKFYTSLEKELTKNPSYMRELFTADEIANMRRFARVAKRITTSPDGSQSSARTAEVLSNMLKGSALQKIPVVRNLPLVKEIGEIRARRQGAKKVRKAITQN